MERRFRRANRLGIWSVSRGNQSASAERSFNNMEVRQRRFHQDSLSDNTPDALDDGRPSKGETIDRRFTILIISTVLVLSLGLTSLSLAPTLLPGPVHSALDGFLSYLGVDQRTYAIVLDAGSTGTRILVFSFHHNPLSGDYALEDQVFAQRTPGISSFAQEPLLAAESVKELLSHAYDKIPLYKRGNTPVTLKATAGLRLLPPESAQALLSSVNAVLEASGFNSLGAEIMNPMEEGLFGWFTLNYLMKSFSSDYVCLDLGGGSTQISFSPSSPPESLIEPWMKTSQFIHRVQVLREERDLYSHSYLGLGILSVRRELFKGLSESEAISSPCIGRNARPFHHTFQDFNYTLVGDPRVTNPYEACHALIKDILRKKVRVHRPSEILGRRIAAFSYYFDRALDRGLLPEGSLEGTLRVQDFTAVAVEACNDEVDLHKFHCLDLTYISSLLLDGYGFPGSQEIHLFKKIQGYEVSWALGVAYTLL